MEGRTGSAGRRAALVGSFVLIALTVVLLPQLGSAQETTPNDTFGSATRITFPGGSREGTIDPAGDVDYFVFTVGAIPAQLEATLTNLPANYDLDLYGPDTTLLATSNRPGTLGESISYPLTQTGDYWLRVYSPGGESSASRYLLRADGVVPTPTPTVTPTATQTPTVTATPADAYEPNETYAQAQEIPVGETVRARIAVASDRDFFRFEGQSFSRITVTLSDLPADYDLYLDKPDQTAAASSTNLGTTPEEIVYDTGTTPGTYYVVVLSNRGGSSDASYSLRVETEVLPGAPTGFRVSQNGDEVDTNRGDGICRTASGSCSLRAAVQEANASAGPQTIDLPAGIFVFENAAQVMEPDDRQADLDITDDTTIRGAGIGRTVLDPQQLGQHFDVHARGTLRLQDITLTNATRIAQFPRPRSIGNSGNLHLARVEITANPGLDQVDYCTALVVNSGTLNVESSRVHNNVRGLAILNSGTLTMRGTSLEMNTVARSCGRPGGTLYGAGLSNLPGATALVVGSTVADNLYDESWGGVSAGTRGGGIYNAGTLTLTNSTISRNHAAGLAGGVHNLGEATLTNVTIADNESDGRAHQIDNADGVRVTLANTIVERPGRRRGATTGAACHGTITSLGHNLGGDDTCALRASGDVSSTDPRLEDLDTNGADTRTHALLPDSPAVDRANAARCPPTDQRGVARPQGSGCDVGAFELVPSGQPPPGRVPPPSPRRLILPVVPDHGSPN